MEGGALVPPQVVAVEAGRQESLLRTHIKVDDRFFAIDPNLDFESSTILAEDRLYVSDQTPSATQPITFTIQPQFNVFKSLSESRFVFTVQAVLPAQTEGLPAYDLVPKPYFSQLLVRDFTYNVNNVATNDQHSRTASYAGFVKILLTEGNLKTACVTALATSSANTTASTSVTIGALSGSDTRSLQEGIVGLDCYFGLDYIAGYNSVVLKMIGGVASTFGNFSYYYDGYTGGGPAASRVNVPIEITYRPMDGVWIQPKMLPAGVAENIIFNFNTIGTWCNAFTAVDFPLPASILRPQVIVGINADVAGITFNVLKAQYYQRQYTISQTGLKAYQSLIMRQPLYYSCMTSNTLLYPIQATQQSVQLTNVFSGRLPNIVCVMLLNQSISRWSNTNVSGNSWALGSYSPLPTLDKMDVPATSTPTPLTGLPADCINNVILTVNGRVYPHLWSSNMQSYSTQDLSQWYEQYRQCALITALNGRADGQSNTNFDVKYKFDNPILSKEEFQSNVTLLCYNIRRNNTVVNCSGDKEVGGIDLLVNINGTSHPNAQLMIVGINTDSILTITDGGSTSSFVF